MKIKEEYMSNKWHNSKLKNIKEKKKIGVEILNLLFHLHSNQNPPSFTSTEIINTVAVCKHPQKEDRIILIAYGKLTCRRRHEIQP